MVSDRPLTEGDVVASVLSPSCGSHHNKQLACRPKLDYNPGITWNLGIRNDCSRSRVALNVFFGRTTKINMVRACRFNLGLESIAS